MLLPNSINYYGRTTVQDLYNLAVKDLIAASLMHPSAEACTYFEPIVKCEVSKGPDNPGKNIC